MNSPGGRTRFDILQALNSTPLGFTKISEQVDITTSEASRQIARLIKADLIEKSSDGMYYITPFGRLLLSFIPGIDYIYNNRDYFLLHDTAPLPNEFIMRFGEISNARFIRGAIDTVNLLQKCIQNVTGYHCAMVDTVIHSMIPQVIDNIRAGADFKLIFPYNYEEEFARLVDEYAITDECLNVMEIRTLPSVPLYIGVTDAGCWFKLPDFEGNIDHSVIIVGKDPVFSRWCHDLYAYYWEQAKPLMIPRLPVRDQYEYSLTRSKEQ